VNPLAEVPVAAVPPSEADPLGFVDRHVWTDRMLAALRKGGPEGGRWYRLHDKVFCERKLMRVLPKRLGKYGLTLHPEKTRLVRFQQPMRRNGKDREGEHPMTFDCLGFTHYLGLAEQAVGLVAAATAKNCSLRMYSETMTGRTVCSKWARTGPRGSRPGLLGGSIRQIRPYGSGGGAALRGRPCPYQVRPTRD
jgi:hypothetical protein